ncbi:MAG: glycosyltransferase family 4 protein, partial [Muribaculaceae bacterium]|nr:glycosyltransferase family 4 protein [Muribaculaceae bacterium]
MRYYICITPFFPTPTSFVGPYVLDQVKAIERNSSYKVIVLKPTSFLNKEDDYEYDGIKVYRFVDYALPSNLLPNGLSDALTYKAFLNKLANIGVRPEDIAVCHAHVASLGATAVRLKRSYPHIKTVIQHHGFDVMSETDGKFADYKWHKKLCRQRGAAICNEADLNIGVSRLTLDYVESVPNVNLKDTYVLYNGVDTTLFKLADKTSNNGIFTIGCIGNFWVIKDQMTLIRAVELLVVKGITNLKVRFIGTGITRAECESYICEKRLTPYFEFVP